MGAIPRASRVSRYQTPRLGDPRRPSFLQGRGAASIVAAMAGPHRDIAVPSAPDAELPHERAGRRGSPLLDRLVCRALLAWCTLVAAVPATALAQALATPREPRVSRTYPVFVGYLFMFLMIAIIIGISLMPSKRAHQD